MKNLDTRKKNFSKGFQKFLNRSATTPPAIEKKVAEILKKIQRQGDVALVDFTRRFDGWGVSAHKLKVSHQEIRKAYQEVDPKVVGALKRAARRIEKFHKRQIIHPWWYSDHQVYVGEIVAPLRRVGLYVPGGRAAYPSTVLMTAIPAKVAGVKDIVMVTPALKGKINPYTLVAADLMGVKEIYKIGGAQAVAALAFGTEQILKVDKIVGPGNLYVATAKKQVFGHVDIDAIAGPTEVAIVADNSAKPAYVAADLISQAEHDPEALVILLTPSVELIQHVTREILHQVRTLPKRGIVIQALLKSALMIRTRTLAEAAGLVNQIAPEHLQIMTRNSRSVLWKKIHNAGTIFIGDYAPTAIGDYAAGVNHVLPTGGTARFASALGVLDFVKRTQVVDATRRGLQRLAKDVMSLATVENLEGHARSIQVRFK